MPRHASNDLKTSTFPINRLPNELLDCVLVEACHDAYDYVVVPPPSHVDSTPRYSALTISWVCARWRAIVLANPACWTPAAIDIHLPEIEDVADEPVEHRLIIAQSIALLGCYFERSKAAPLEVHFSEYLNDEERWEATVGEVVRFACSTMSRWKTCRLPSYLVDWLSKDPPPHEPPLQLQSATVYYQEIYDDFAVDLFARAPHLQRLAGSFADRTAGVLPWGQLTHLHMSRFISIQFFMSIASQCRRMVKLEVQIWSNPNEPFPAHGPDTAPVVLPNLESADFIMDAGAVLLHLLASLTTPKLSSLRLRGSDRRADDDEQFSGYIRLRRWPMRHFEGWLERSRCDRLASLILADILMPQDDLIGIMERLPRLTEFGLKEHMALQPPERQHDLPIDDGLLRRLTAVDGNRPELLPELKSFIVKGILKFEWPLLLEMVRSRASPRIENLEIYVDDQSTADIDRDTEAGLTKILGSRGFMNKAGSKWDLQRPWAMELFANLEIVEQRAQEEEAQEAAARRSVL
ncbi:hypothetical protein GGF50DRAFT_45880 [Schizophyllum commune]